MACPVPKCSETPAPRDDAEGRLVSAGIVLALALPFLAFSAASSDALRESKVLVQALGASLAILGLSRSRLLPASGRGPAARVVLFGLWAALTLALFSAIANASVVDPLTLAAVIAPELLTLKEYFVDVDISGGVSMGNTFADFFNTSKKPANMKVALDVRGDDFVALFLGRMESLSRSISD